jgi:hypothetical protein
VNGDVPPRFDSRRLRRAGLAATLALGFALLGTGVQGLAGVDAELDAASDRQRESVPVERNWRDCPRHRDAVSERESL